MLGYTGKVNSGFAKIVIVSPNAALAPVRVIQTNISDIREMDFSYNFNYILIDVQASKGFQLGKCTVQRS